MEDRKLTVSVEECARLLNISRGLAYSSIRSGQIPALRFGRILRVPRAALENLMGNANLNQGENHEQATSEDE